MQESGEGVRQAPPPRGCARARGGAGAERRPLTQLSARAREAAAAALGGPGGVRAAAVERSVRRGRIALKFNYWEGHEDDARLARLSPAYGRLKGYQKVGVRWLLAQAQGGFGSILADEMGLGKTAQTLTFLDLWQSVGRDGRSTGDQVPSEPPEPDVQRPVRPSLVLIPASVINTWETEAQKWCPHLTAFTYHAGSARERCELADKYFAEHDGRCALILTTAGVLHCRDDRAFFFGRLHFDFLVIDEAHCMKNSESARFRDVTRGIRVDRRVLLTGTPVQNSLRELANLLTIVLAAPGEQRGQGRRTSAVVEELGRVVETGSLRALQTRAAPLILRRLKRNVMSDLPPKQGHTLRCALDGRQQALYDAEVSRARAAAQRGGRDTLKARREFVRTLFHRLRRLCGHPLLSQTRLDERDYGRLVDLLCGLRPDFQKAPRERALAHVKGWSDFDVAVAVRDYGLADRLGPGFDRARFEMPARAELVEGSAKIKELIRLLRKQREAGAKTLVFSQFTEYLDVIGEALSAEGFMYARLDGGTKIEDRPEVMQNFQAKGSGVDVFLLSMKAGGTGLNLTAADVVVLMDVSFNPQDNRQA
ncbi:unnamed protein product, partial [Prorocentrum cordatum]